MNRFCCFLIFAVAVLLESATGFCQDATQTSEASQESTEVQETKKMDQQWAMQLSPGDWGECYGLSVGEQGNVYATGFTAGELNGVKAKAKDAFLAKYDSEGKMIWGKLLGTKDVDIGNDVAADGKGNVYTTGVTSGKLGETLAGSVDAFVAKHDSSGELIWVRQLGTESRDEAQAIATDLHGNVVVTGWTRGGIEGPNAGGDDVFVAKYDAAGELLWKVQFGTKEAEQSRDIATDHEGNILVTGSTGGGLKGENAGSDDPFLAKFSPEGEQLWIQQFGTSSLDMCFGVASDSAGDIFISGHTMGKLGEKKLGGIDLFVSKFDSQGEQKWTRQHGTSHNDSTFGMAIDDAGNLFIGGGTKGSFEGSSNQGSRDAFLARLNPDGELVSTFQLGTPHYDKAMAVTVDQQGSVFFGGDTRGRFGTSEGFDHSDGFVVKIKMGSEK